MVTLLKIAGLLVEDAFRWLLLLFRSAEALRTENLFLRRQLALYIECGIPPRWLDAATRVGLAPLARLYDWARRVGGRAAGDDDPLAPRGLETPLANEVSSRSASDPARAPRADSQDARENVLWGEERIANELLLKLGVRISPRTVGKYLPKRPPGRRRGDLRWSTFLRNEATAILACDFFVAVTATFRMLYVFVVIEHGTRRLAHVNVTTHPSAGLDAAADPSSDRRR